MGSPGNRSPAISAGTGYTNKEVEKERFSHHPRHLHDGVSMENVGIQRERKQRIAIDPLAPWDKRVL